MTATAIPATRALLLVAVAATAGPLCAQEPGAAPDGRRGFGAEATRAEIVRVLRSEDDDDRAFREGLTGLVGSLELHLELLSERYAAAGYPALFDEEDPAAEEVHRFWRACEGHGLERLAELEQDEPRARLFARLFADVDLRLRARALEGWEEEAAELSGSLALLGAQAEGYADLRPTETRDLAARADLAAARLRAVLADLEALRGEAPQAEEQEDAARSLLAAGRANGRARERAFAEARDRLARFEQRRIEDLASVRLAASQRDALLIRDEKRVRAATYPPRVRELLPDYPEGLAAPPAVEELSSAKRYAFAARTAIEGLSLDPLHAELCYLVGHATSFLSGDREARKWFDRFLALHRIRGHDHRTYSGRELDPEEKRALEVVQRRFLSGR